MYWNMNMHMLSYVKKRKSNEATLIHIIHLKLDK